MVRTQDLVACHFCAKQINVKLPGNYQFVSGWAKNRTGGGAHGISLPEKKPLFACGYCVERRSKGLAAQGVFEILSPPTPAVTPASAGAPAPTNAAYDDRDMLTHVCNVCGSTNAPYGIGVAVRKGELGLWYCAQHRPKAP